MRNPSKIYSKVVNELPLKKKGITSISTLVFILWRRKWLYWLQEKNCPREVVSMHPPKLKLRNIPSAYFQYASLLCLSLCVGLPWQNVMRKDDNCGTTLRRGKNGKLFEKFKKGRGRGGKKELSNCCEFALVVLQSPVCRKKRRSSKTPSSPSPPPSSYQKRILASCPPPLHSSQQGSLNYANGQAAKKKVWELLRRRKCFLSETSGA